MANTCNGGLDLPVVDLGYARVAALGVLQGITELLPVSSTARMRVVSALPGWRDPGLAFSAAIQLAALAAVVSSFWKDVRQLTVQSIRAVGSRDFADHHLRLVIFIMATVPICVAGLLLSAVYSGWLL